MRFISVFAWTLATVGASPVENGLEKRQGTCGANNIALRVLRGLGPRGSIFCNAVLNLPTSTSEIELPTPATTITEAVTLITGLCTPEVELPEVEIPEVEIPEVEIPELPIPGLEKRQAIPALSLFAGRQITAGCSCLSLAPRTITSFITPLPTPVTVPGDVLTTCGPEPTDA